MRREFRHDLLNGGQHAFGEETVIIEDRTTPKRHSSDQQLEHVLRGLITSMSKSANAMASGECCARWSGMTQPLMTLNRSKFFETDSSSSLTYRSGMQISPS